MALQPLFISGWEQLSAYLQRPYDLLRYRETDGKGNQ